MSAQAQLVLVGESLNAETTHDSQRCKACQSKGIKTDGAISRGVKYKAHTAPIFPSLSMAHNRCSIKADGWI